MSTADLDVGVEKSSIDTRPFCTLAASSLIFGILSFVGLPLIGGLLAVILGQRARTRIFESHNQLRGESTAIVGMTLGFVNLFLFGLLLLFLLTGLFTWRSSPVATPAPFVQHEAFVSPPVAAFAPLAPGVKMANEMGRADFDTIEKLQLASKAEPVICVYNASSDSYNPEIAVLTGKRISYVKEGRITSMDLSEIETILDHRKYMEKYRTNVYPNGYGPDQFNIEIKGKDSTRMRVVVRPGLDGPSFYEALNDAWKAAGGETKVVPAFVQPHSP